MCQHVLINIYLFTQSSQGMPMIIKLIKQKWKWHQSTKLVDVAVTPYTSFTNIIPVLTG